MAKKKRVKRTVNKSAAIRDYKKANPQAMPKEIVAALGKKSIKVTPGTVSTTLSTAKAKKKKRGRRAANNSAVSVDQFKAAASLIRAAGGVDEAKEALAAAEAVAKVIG